MTKKKSPFLSALLLTLFLFCVSCGSNQGIEAGNPSLVGKQLHLTPATGTEDYLISFTDGDTATVDQITKAQGIVLERVTVSYTLASNLLLLEASFSNGREIAIAATVTDSGEITVVTMTIDGLSVVVDFTVTSDDSDSSSSAAGSSLILSDFNDPNRSPNAPLPLLILPRPTK